MAKRTFVWVTIVALAVVAVGVVTASNMAFKLNYRLDAAGAAAKSGTNTLALPFNRQTGIVTANNLIGDIGLANVTNVQQFVEATDTFNVYTGRKGTPSPDFNLSSGDANFVQMAAGVDYIVVGSDNPSLAVALNGPGAGSKTGTNFFAYVYHSTAPTAFDLMNDIGFASVTNVQNFVKTTDSYAVYTGRKGTPSANFNLVPGAGYFIQMGSTVNYVPSHY